jgi:hypothetical protein
MSKWLALYLEILRSFSYSADNQLRTSGRKSEGLNNALKILTDRRRVSIPFCIKTMKLALETLSGDSKSYAKSVIPSRIIRQDRINLAKQCMDSPTLKNITKHKGSGEITFPPTSRGAFPR